MIYVGIDPGKNGGFSGIDENLKVLFCESFDEVSLVRCMNGLDSKETLVGVEKVGAMPGQGVVSMFNFGDNFGFIRGTLSAFGIPYELIPPMKWKREFSITADKNTSIAVCQRLFPGANLLRTEKCKKPHDGKAESLLMALYMRRKLGGDDL